MWVGLGCYKRGSGVLLEPIQAVCRFFWALEAAAQPKLFSRQARDLWPSGANREDQVTTRALRDGASASELADL